MHASAIFSCRAVDCARVTASAWRASEALYHARCDSMHGFNKAQAHSYWCTCTHPTTPHSPMRALLVWGLSGHGLEAGAPSTLSIVRFNEPMVFNMVSVRTFVASPKGPDSHQAHRYQHSARVCVLSWISIARQRNTPYRAHRQWQPAAPTRFAQTPAQR